MLDYIIENYASYIMIVLLIILFIIPNSRYVFQRITLSAVFILLIVQWYQKISLGVQDNVGTTIFAFCMTILCGCYFFDTIKIIIKKLIKLTKIK